MIKVELQNK